MIEIDGSRHEGGGQILRTALSLSSITGKEFMIKNIRKNREKEGLRPQHLIAARSTRKICRGELEGDELDSTELRFKPGKIVSGRYDIKVGTAGSTILIAQTLIPILLYGSKKSELEIEGGTSVPFSPCYDYFENVFIKFLNFMGIEIKSELIKSGYYPEGNGKIRIKMKNNSNFSFPEMIPREEDVKGIIRISKLPFHIALREKKIFVEKDIENVKIIEEENGIGNSVFAYKGFRGSCELGRKGLRAEEVSRKCLEKLESEKGEVDENLADQIMLYAALYAEKTGRQGSYTTKKISEHIKANAYVIEQFLNVKINFENKGETRKISFTKI